MDVWGSEDNLAEKTREELILELEEARRRHYALISSPKLLSVIISREGLILHANKHFCELTGYDVREIINADYIDILVPEDSKTQTRNIINMLMSGFVEFLQYVEADLLCKDGRRFNVGWNNSIHRNIEGTITAMCALGEDLTFKQSRGHTIPPPEVVKPPATTQHAPPQNEAAIPPTAAENLSRRRSSFEFRREELPMYETIGEYLVVQKIGGDNSKVKLGMHKITTEKVAIKNLSKVHMSEEERDRARREIEIMKKLTGLNNPHIVKLKDSLETEDSFVIIMEYVKGGELVGTILRSRDLSEQKVHRWFKQILYAIETCHRNNVVHRDIKLQNILLDEHENVKLIDFGLSNYVEDGVLRSTFCGTPAYASPEILLGNKYEGPEVDVWSLGVVLYSMLTANFPFTTVGDILAGQFEEPTYISPACLSLLKKMLCVDTEKRITLAGIIADPWIQRGPGSSHTQSFPIAYENTSLELERQEREAQRRQQHQQVKEYETLVEPPPPMAIPLLNFTQNNAPMTGGDMLHITEFDIEPAYKKMRGL